MPDEHLPLSPTELAVLLHLEEAGPAYGYGIVKGIAARSVGSIRLAPGNLYQVLDRMEERGWLKPVAAPEGGDARRRYYALTSRGRSAAALEASRLRAMQPALQRLELAAKRGRG